jgi:hypothetical protein
MKRITFAVAVAALFALILLPVLGSVNYSFGNSGQQRVDGGPYPLPPGPPVDGLSLLVADGGPYPLPPGPPIDSPSLLIADGGPYPLPPGPPIDNPSVLVADGGPYPLPPGPPIVQA